MATSITVQTSVGAADQRVVSNVPVAAAARRLGTVSVIVAALSLGSAGHAQDVRSVAPAFDPDEWLSSNSVIEFRVDGFTGAEGSRLAVIIGDTDVSAFVQRAGNSFRYDPRIVRLPAGEQEVTVYEVSAQGAWSEIGRMPIRVLTRRGFERISYDPGLSVDNAGQLAEGHSEEQLAPDRDTYQDFTFRTGLETRHVRPGLTVRSQLNAVGVTNQQQALRFGLKQDDAPKYDLADYLIKAEAGRAAFSIGHVSAGANRHLINGFASRGIAVETGAGPFSAKLAALNGSSVVGWSNPSGLGESGHRILSGEIGVEAFPDRPGVLHLDATFVDGSVLPVTGFNQAAVVDAETSRGVGLQLQASDPSGRIRLNGGYARSEYNDVEDQALSRGLDLVIIREEVRDARHLDLSFDVLRGLQLGESTFATLSTALRHERVDPLYRSVASFAQSDLQENAVDVTASVGPINARYGHSRRNDNLDEIPSILTTLTRSHQFNLAVPLGFLVGKAANTWFPQMSYTLNRVHQFGEGVPVNGGFSASHVPDQLTSVQGVSAQWFHSTWQLAYRLDRSTQDNRQEGRENADFERTAQTVTLGWNPWPSLGMSVDGSVEKNMSAASDQTSKAERLALSTNIRLASRTAVTLFGSQSWTRDPFENGTERTVRQVRVELSQGLTILDRPGTPATGQFFVRFARQRGTLFGAPAAGDTPVTWTLNTGFNLSLF